jgi:hypothetical protein
MVQQLGIGTNLQLFINSKKVQEHSTKTIGKKES